MHTLQCTPFVKVENVGTKIIPWCRLNRLHTVSSNNGDILQLSRQFEVLLQETNPQLVFHLLDKVHLIDHHHLQLTLPGTHVPDPLAPPMYRAFPRSV
jgi:hypothetical protein